MDLGSVFGGLGFVMLSGFNLIFAGLMLTLVVLAIKALLIYIRKNS